MSSTEHVPFHVVIPARLASSRLPNKPLADIHGKPMIQWVYENALKSEAQSVTVATDDEQIVNVVSDFGGNVCMTRSDHLTGTDRIVEVCQKKQWTEETIIVNCQGDEPLMPEQNLTQVARIISQKQAPMSTLFKQISKEMAQDPNQVKLVCDQQGKALYFSRSIIPFDRDEREHMYLGHIGLYAYRVGFLKTYSALQPCDLEQAEKLEQLRALYYGYDIYAELAHKIPGPGVDTEDDLAKVKHLMNEVFG